jgi:Lipocalin-like domain
MLLVLQKPFKNMKRLFLAIALFSASLIVLESCSPKTSSGTTAVRRGNVTGNWVLNNISFEGIPDVAVKSFLGENSYKCFVGSTWRLTNSGNGSYSLPSSASCAAKTQTIFWSVTTADETFQFKKLYEGEKAKNVTEGYRLLLSGADDNTLVLKSPIEYGGRTAYVVLNYVKAVK